MSSLATSAVANDQPYLTVSSNSDQPHSISRSLTVNPLYTIEIGSAFGLILNFFNYNGIVEVVESNILPAGNLYYGDRLNIVFKLTKKHSQQFPLLRGLLAFGKYVGLNVTSSGGDKTFNAIITSGHEENVIEYFQTVFSDLVNDAEFKKVLKDLLKLQSEATQLYKASLGKLYSGYLRTKLK